jgi:hypothetical protein
VTYRGLENPVLSFLYICDLDKNKNMGFKSECFI